MQKETDLKKECDALGPVAVSTKRKSSSAADEEDGGGAGGSSSNSSKKVAASGEGNRPIAKRAVQYNSSDEEGDFQAMRFAFERERDI